jgi:autotransporter translocation and assembly factor TamB
MTETAEQVKKRRRWPWITLAVILVLVAGLRLALRSDLLLDYIRSQAETRVSEMIHGDLRVDRLSGDLWSHVTVTGVAVYAEANGDDPASDADTSTPEPGTASTRIPGPVLSLDTLHVSWSVFDLLFRRPLEIRELHALGLRADLVQYEDGNWNIMELLPEEDGPDEEPSGINFVLSDVRITAPEISVDARAVLPGEPLVIRDLETRLRLGRTDPDFFADLKQLELFLHESRLDAPVQLSSEASWDGRRITLDHLLIATAYSLFEASGSYDDVTYATRFQALLDPLAWREVEAYAEEYPIRQNLNVELRVGGSRQDLSAGFTLDAPGLEQFTVDTRWSVMQEPVLRSLSMQSGRIDAATLTGTDTLQASIAGFALSLEGAVPVMEWDRIQADGNLRVEDARFEAYSVDVVSLDIAASPGSIRAGLDVRKGGEVVTASLEAARWWEEDIDWTLQWHTDDLNVAYWAALEEPDATVTMRGSVSGTGYAPAGTPWTAAITLERLAMAGYPDITAEMEAELTGERLRFESPVRIDGAELDLAADLLWTLDVPAYEATLHFRNLDASRFPGLEQLATDINGQAEVRGEGFDPATMALDASFLMSRSHINRQPFEELKLDLQLRDGIARVDEATLLSETATANLSLRQNILDFHDLRNRLAFELELLDLQGFADLAGAEVLSVPGRFEGTITADTAGQLVLQTDLNLHSIQYDTIRVESVTGTASAVLAAETRFHADLEIRDPSAGPYAFRDITFTTDGRFGDSGLTGTYTFAIQVEAESGISQTADYHIADTVRVHTRELRLTDPATTYDLQRPFDVVLSDGKVRVDTLHLASGTGSELRLGISKTPETPWTGFLDAQETDLGQLQYIFLDEPLFHAVFSGDIRFRFDEEVLDVSGRADLKALEWETVRLDSIRLAFDIGEHRLLTDATVWHDGLTLLRSEFDLPFEPTDPGELAEEFFDRPVEGYIRIHPIEIQQYEGLLSTFGMERTRGEFSMSAELSGTAGSPDLTGGLYLKNGTLSDVAIDSLIMEWDYDHGRSDIFLTSRVHSLGQKAADIQGSIPLHLDFQGMEFQGPDPSDEIDFTIFTTDFNLAAFNDFLDPAMLRNLEGRLNADFSVSGTIGEPLAEGAMVLSGGQVRLVENQVTLRNISMNVEMAPGRVVLQELSVQSVGSFSGSGEIALDGLALGRIDLRFRATNFRAFNTRDLEIYAGMDVTMTGTLEEPLLTGTVRWERGTIFLDEFGEREVEEVILDEEQVEETEGPEFFDRLALELIFSVDRNAFVRNRRDPEIFLAPRGEIDIIKEAFGELQLFGDMGITSGHVTTFNKRFQLERGDVTFSGDPMEPMLNIRTLYRPRQQYEDIRIYYVITGTLSDPEFEYESEPEMGLQDIISYTLSGGRSMPWRDGSRPCRGVQTGAWPPISPWISCLTASSPWPLTGWASTSSRSRIHAGAGAARASRPGSLSPTGFSSHSCRSSAGRKPPARSSSNTCCGAIWT